VILSHRIALDPTVKQRIYFAKAAGTARFAWNWALAEWERQYKAGLKPNAFELKKQFNAIKGDEFSWVYEVLKEAAEVPFYNLQKAYERFFKKTSKHPRFKRKGRRDSFYVANNYLSTDGFKVKIPKLGWVRMHQELRFQGKIMGATVSREADRWFIAIQVDVGEAYRRQPADKVVNSTGVDLGILHAATRSNGEVFDAPKPLKRHLKRLRRLSRRLSRKKKGSNNRRKAGRRVAKLHQHISNIRKDWTHKTTTHIIAKTKLVCLEDLNVRGMTQNRSLARAIADLGFYEFRRQLEYKAPLYGHRVAVVDRWAPTSKTCSACGHKKESMALSERVFHCESCGLRLDRDVNAAKNIRTLGLRGINACGLEGSGVGRKTNTKPRRVEAGTTQRRRLRV
jgi:putative transposase